MKVLHVSYSARGGAFIAMRRIDESLGLHFGDEYSSRFLILDSVGGMGAKFISVFNGPWDRLISYFRPRIVRLLTNIIFKSEGKATVSFNILCSPKIVKFINSSSFDIIHLHWIGGETISIKDFKRIRKPIVWTLHDCWAFMGRHHLPVYGNAAITNKGIDIFLRNIKRKSWMNLGMEVLCVSDWLKEEVDRSGIFIGNRITRIYNGIDTHYWRPMELVLARDLLNLSIDKTYFTMGAVNPTSDFNKGFSLLKDSLNFISDEMKENVEILMFGITGDNIVLSGVKIKFMGEIADELALKILYAACNVILVPSFYESFGQTALEGISMGKPVVCFDSSGTVEIVKHLENGYVAKSFCTDDFAQGIIWAIDNSRSFEVASSSRAHAVKTFDYREISREYLSVYYRAVNKTRNT